MAKYIITHWVTADFIAEKVVDESEIDTIKNDLKGNSIPDGTFSFVMLKGNKTNKKANKSINYFC